MVELKPCESAVILFVGCFGWPSGVVDVLSMRALLCFHFKRAWIMRQDKLLRITHYIISANNARLQASQPRGRTQSLVNEMALIWVNNATHPDYARMAARLDITALLYEIRAEFCPDRKQIVEVLSFMNCSPLGRHYWISLAESVRGARICSFAWMHRHDRMKPKFNGSWSIIA